MRRLLSVLVILCLAVGMLCIPAVAADSTPAFYDKDNAGITANGGALLGDVTYTAASGTTPATYSVTFADASLINGGFYVLLSVSATANGNAYTHDAISENSIQYIDQTIAEAEASNGKVTFANFIPKSLGKDQVLLLGGKFNGKTSPIALGVILSQGVEVSGYVSTYNPQNATKIEFFPAGTYESNKTNFANLPEADAEGEIAATTGTGKNVQAFTVEGVAEGTYDVRISKDTHLAYWVKGYAVGGSAASMNEYSGAYVLPCGDTNGDNFINANDIFKLVAKDTYNKSVGEAANKNADLNGDGFIDANDIIILVSKDNYMKEIVVK